jgi:hypothetical protein
MFVKLTQLSLSDSGTATESQVAINVNHVIEISPAPKPGMVYVVLSSLVSTGINHRMLVKGTLDETMIRLSGQNPNVVARAS